MPYVPTIQDLDLPIEQLLKLADEQKKWDREHTYVIDIN